MQIMVDGQERPQTDLKGRTIGDILLEIKRGVSTSGRIVVGIICDGEAVSPERIQDVLKETADRYGLIDFQTAQPKELARNSLLACREFLNDIEHGSRDIVADLQQSQVQTAMGRMGPMFSKLNDAYRGLQGTMQLLNIDPESVELSSGTAGKFMTALVDKLRNVKEALENQDYVSWADLFQYELDPAIVEWRQLVDHLLESLGES